VILIGLVATVRSLCDKEFAPFNDFNSFDANAILAEQAKLINTTIACLTATSQKTLGSVQILAWIRENIAAMDSEMMAWAKQVDKQGVPVILDVANSIHWNVYDVGFYKALAETAFISNKTDQPLAVGKFAATSKVIRWRSELDGKRRLVQPTQCKDVAGGQADWETETKNVVTTLQELIPRLHALGSEYWATQHQKMLDFIQQGIPTVQAKVDAVQDQAKKAQVLCLLVEQLHLLNTVASSRPPE